MKHTILCQKFQTNLQIYIGTSGASLKFTIKLDEVWLTHRRTRFTFDTFITLDSMMNELKIKNNCLFNVMMMVII